MFTNNWAKSLLYRLFFGGSSTTKMTVQNFEMVKEQFLLDIKVVVEMEDVPPELIFNWDQTRISIVPGSSWTREVMGSKQVEIATDYCCILWCIGWRVPTITANLPGLCLSPSLQVSG